MAMHATPNFTLPFDFSGRIARLTYVKTTAIVMFFDWVLAATFSAAKSLQGMEVAVALAAIVALQWLMLAACVRRLHDLGSTGWWALLLLIPLVNLVLLLYLALVPGRRLPNKYGDPQNYTDYERLINAARRNKEARVEQIHIEQEERLWSKALEEFEQDRRPGVWARAFSESNGNADVAKAAYLKIRIGQMKSTVPLTPDESVDVEDDVDNS